MEKSIIWIVGIVAVVAIFGIFFMTGNNEQTVVVDEQGNVVGQFFGIFTGISSFTETSSEYVEEDNLNNIEDPIKDIFNEKNKIFEKKDELGRLIQRTYRDDNLMLNTTWDYGIDTRTLTHYFDNDLDGEYNLKVTNFDQYDFQGKLIYEENKYIDFEEWFYSEEYYMKTNYTYDDYTGKLIKEIVDMNADVFVSYDNHQIEYFYDDFERVIQKVVKKGDKLYNSFENYLYTYYDGYVVENKTICRPEGSEYTNRNYNLVDINEPIGNYAMYPVGEEISYYYNDGLKTTEEYHWFDGVFLESSQKEEKFDPYYTDLGVEHYLYDMG